MRTKIILISGFLMFFLLSFDLMGIQVNEEQFDVENQLPPFPEIGFDVFADPGKVFKENEVRIISIMHNLVPEPLFFALWGVIKYEDRIVFEFNPLKLMLYPFSKLELPLFYHVPPDAPPGRYEVLMTIGENPEVPWITRTSEFGVVPPSPVKLQMEVSPRKVFPGEIAEGISTIENVTQETQEFNVWGGVFFMNQIIVKLEPQHVILEPAEQINLTFPAQIPAKARFGEYRFELFAGVEPEKEWTGCMAPFLVIKPTPVKLYVSVEPEEVPQNGEIEIIATLQNTTKVNVQGIFSSLLGSRERVLLKMEPAQFNLKPGEVREIHLIQKLLPEFFPDIYWVSGNVCKKPGSLPWDTDRDFFRIVPAQGENQSE